MNKLSIDNILVAGDVIRITDAADSDFGRLFVYRGRLSGYNVLDPTIGDQKPVAVEHLPAYSRLFQLKGTKIPSPSENISDGSYGAVLQDLGEISLLSDRISAQDLGLIPEYDMPRYRRRDTELIDADLRKTGEAKYFDIQKTGFSLRQEVPKDCLFSSVWYKMTTEGLVWIAASTTFWRLDGAYGLGCKDKHERYTQGRMKSKERKTQVYNHVKLGRVFSSLLQNGILVSEITRDFPPDIKWVGSEHYINDIFNDGISASIIETPVKDFHTTKTRYFDSLLSAWSHMQTLIDKTPKLPKEYQIKD